MRKIFITYRRTEAEFAAGALGRELRRHFGDEQVFRDKENIAGGAAWKRQLLHEIDKDSALLVLMGRDWADARDGGGKRRLDNPADGLRLEISDGIKDGAVIIPVLLENAQMPDEEELPGELKALVEFNALKLRDGDWHRDIETICRTLEQVGFTPLATSPQPIRPDQPTPTPALKAGLNAKAVIGATLVILALSALALADLDRTDYLGMAAISIAGLALGILSWREIRGAHDLGRIFAAVVATMAAFALFAAMRGYARIEGGDGGGGGSLQGGREGPVATIPTKPAPPTPNLVDELTRMIEGDPSARSVLDQHVEAIGGREALLRHSSRVTRGTLSISGTSGPLEWYAAKPNKVVIKLQLAGMGEASEGFDGTRGWKTLPFIGPQLLAGKELEDKRLESDFHAELTHEERYASVTVDGQTEFEGRPCVKLRLLRKSGEEDFEFYEVASGLRAGSIAKYQSPTGRMDRTIVLADYRRFGDLLHPTRITERGLMEQVLTVTSIEYDNVPPDVFELPATLRVPAR